MLDNAETVLSEAEKTITGLPAQRPHRDEVFAFLRTAQDVLQGLRSAVDKRELDALRAARQELRSVADRLEALGMA